jgi:pimeloyl-ACP methyl ester carboxylesterase
MTTIVLTHGAFHGGWCFEPLVRELGARGVGAVVLDLPLTDLDADAAAVTSVLDNIEGPVTLLGHSYGGSVITVAGNHPSVEHLVYLAALGPDEGERASGGPVAIGDEFISAMRLGDDGVMFIDPELAARVFYPDIDVVEAARWVGHLRPGNTGGASIVERAAWRTVASTYVVCCDDPIILPDAQRAIAARIGANVVEIEGDHSPMVARPAELADILCALLD